VDVAALISDGWDPALAYLTELSRQGQKLDPPLTQSRVKEVAAGLSFYPGIPDCFEQLKDQIESEPKYRDYGIRVEFYVISGGIEELIASSPLRPALHDLWGCSFAYDSEGRIAGPKRALSFTDKTRYVFNIQKGKVGEEFKNQPYVVNEPMEQHERSVPFSNMVYLGDGPSDIPCMSLLQNNGGYVIGILSQDKPFKSWALGYGRRAHLTVPPEFEPGQYGFVQLHQALVGKADDICRRLLGSAPVPEH